MLQRAPHFNVRISKRCRLFSVFCFLFLAVCFLFLVSSPVAHAQPFTPLVHCGLQPGPDTPAGFDRACTVCDLGVLVIRITNFLIRNVAIPLAGLMIVVGGVMIMLGAASEARVTSGKKILTNTLIGVVVVFISWVAVDTIIKVLTGSADFAGSPGQFFGALGPWNEVRNPGDCPL